MNRTHLNRLIPTILTVAAALVTPSSSSAQPKPGAVQSLSVATNGGATTLTVRTNRKLDWTAKWLPDGRLQLNLPGSAATDGVTGLTPGGGLVASVAAFNSQADGLPATILEVSLRQPASFTAAVGRKRIELTFRPRAPEPTTIESAPAAPAEPADAADTPHGTSEPAFESEAVPDTADPEASPAAATAATAATTGINGRTARSETTASGAPGPAEPSKDRAPAFRNELSGEYRIGPGDLLEISVFGLDDFDRTVRVLGDGSISLPLLGGLRVLDMTLQEAQTTVAGLLSEGRLVNDPQVTFFVKEYVSRGVSVQGAVERPGVYQMIQQRTLLEILGEAGGLSGRESGRAGQEIFVIRKMSDGQQRRIEVDADQLINQGRADLNIFLYPGDVVLVPFAQKYRVYVSGAVARPGPVEYLSNDGITVLQAITAAGGSTERGNLGNVKILRKLPDGSETRIVVNVKKIRKGKTEDVGLERNDTVIVGEWFF